MSILLLNFTGLKPSRYTEKLMLKGSSQITKFIEIVMSSGSKTTKMMCLKWIA